MPTLLHRIFIVLTKVFPICKDLWPPFPAQPNRLLTDVVQSIFFRLCFFLRLHIVREIKLRKTTINLVPSRTYTDGDLAEPYIPTERGWDASCRPLLEHTCLLISSMVPCIGWLNLVLCMEPRIGLD